MNINHYKLIGITLIFLFLGAVVPWLFILLPFILIGALSEAYDGDRGILTPEEIERKKKGDLKSPRCVECNRPLRTEHEKEVGYCGHCETEDLSIATIA